MTFRSNLGTYCARIEALPGMPTETSGVGRAQAQGRLSHIAAQHDGQPALDAPPTAGPLTSPALAVSALDHTLNSNQLIQSNPTNRFLII